MSWADLNYLQERYSTTLSDTQLQAFLDDAQFFVTEAGWKKAIEEKAEDAIVGLKTVHAYLAIHLIQLEEQEIDSDSVQNLSVSYNTANKDVMEWLRNTEPGRTLARMLEIYGVGEPSNRAAPRTFR